MTDGSDRADSTDAADRAALADRAAVADPADRAALADPVDLADRPTLADPADPADRALLADPADPADRAAVADPGDLADRLTLADPADPADRAALADRADRALLADPADRAAAAAADGPPALRFPFDAAALTAAPLRTERLVLRPIEASDATDVYEYQRLPEVIRYLPWPERDRTEGFEHTAKRAAGRVLAADEDFFVFAATLPGTPSTDDPAHDRVIGDFMVRVSSVQHARLEVGWVLHPDFQGHGYAREAAGAVLDFVFETLNPHRVEAFLDARNAASAALCERLGMRREATLLEEEYNDGEWQDTAVYGVLRREWAARRA